MKVMSLKIKGLGSPSKNIFIEKLVELENPYIILLQETMGAGEKSIGVLKSCLEN